MHSKPILKYFIFVLILLGLFLFLNFQKNGFKFLSLKNPQDPNNPTPKITKPVNKDILTDSKEIWNNQDALYSYLAKFGPKQTTIHLNELSSQFGSCHDVAHLAGRLSYEMYDSAAFKLCSGECHSGCYHGATEAFFRANGTSNLAENLKVICSSELNPFFSHQCLHGIGHGLMAWASYDLPSSLKSCELLPNDSGIQSCYTGVFMENIVGGLTDKKSEHYTKYLSDDPQFPCNEVEEKYKSSCYFLQTSRMLQIFGVDFKKVAEACSNAPTTYQRTCFESMGRDVGGVYPGKELSSITACSFAPAGMMREGCLIGAAQDSFWDPTGQDAALRFCKTLTETSEKSACYTTIFQRSPQVLLSKSDQQKFCSKAEPQFVSLCQQYIQ
jgi:hypothetical protein